MIYLNILQIGLSIAIYFAHKYRKVIRRKIRRKRGEKIDFERRIMYVRPGSVHSQNETPVAAHSGIANTSVRELFVKPEHAQQLQTSTTAYRVLMDKVVRPDMTMTTSRAASQQNTITQAGSINQ